jgi:hypothetical protein
MPIGLVVLIGFLKDIIMNLLRYGLKEKMKKMLKYLSLSKRVTVVLVMVVIGIVLFIIELEM